MAIPTGRKIHKCVDGRFAIDWTALAALIGANARAQVLSGARKVPIEEHLLLPNVYTLDVDWDKAAVTSKQAVAGSLPHFYRLIVNGKVSGEDMIKIVDTYQHSTSYELGRYWAYAKQVSDENLRQQVWGESLWGNAASGARLLRDMSAEVLMIGATALSGGLAAGMAVSVGASIKTTAKYQDTGNVAAAVLTGTTELLFGSIKLAKLKPNGAEKAIIAFVKAGFEAGRSVIEGESMTDAVFGAAASTGLELLGNTKMAERLVKRAAVPLEVRIGGMLNSGKATRYLAEGLAEASIGVTLDAGKDTALESLKHDKIGDKKGQLLRTGVIAHPNINRTLVRAVVQRV